MKKNNAEFRWEHVSYKCLIRTLSRNAWMIVAAAAVCALAASLLITWTYKPQYQASMTYVVNSRGRTSSTGNLTSTREVASVMEELLTEDMMYDSIRKSDPRLADFNGTITATQVTDTNFIVVSATGETPESAFLAIAALMQEFPNTAKHINEQNVLNVVRNPYVTTTPINPTNVQTISLVMAVLGAIAMAALICYLSIIRGTVQNRTGARHLVDAPVIASVGHERKNTTLKAILRRSKKHVQVFSPTTSFAYTEQISAICSQMEHESTARDRKVFLVTGIGESEGKSTVSGNVAASLALKGHKVVLLDCDLRKPAQSKFFDNEYIAELPLNKLLSQPYSEVNVEKCLYLSERTGLYMMCGLKSDARSAELLSSDTTLKLIARLREDYDFVVIDSPPTSMFPDAEVLADRADATMLVVRQDYVPACDINDHIDTLRKYKAAFLGIILNDMLSDGNGQYGYGRYGYGRYGYGSKYGYGSHYGYGDQKTSSRHHSKEHTDRKEK